MPESNTQEILQAGLKSGMSATEGFHSSKPTWIDPSNPPAPYTRPDSFIPTASTRVTLRGKESDVIAPAINIGAWAWGDIATWQWSDDELPSLRSAWKLLQENGINWIDTAQAYGSGASEKICGDLFKGMNRSDFILQTKWYVVPDNTKNLLHTSLAPVKWLEESLARLRLDYVDVYLVHGHIHLQSKAQVAKGLAECVEKGLAKTVGVANYSAEDMIALDDELKKYGVPLATNQCEFSVLRRYPEINGLIKACHERGIVFQSYSSLAQGRLSGKYSPENPAPETHRFSSYPPEEIEKTLNVLRAIGDVRGKSPASIALNYNMVKGAVPTVGVRNLKHAEDVVAALGWRLNDEELEKIDAVSMEGKTTVTWPAGLIRFTRGSLRSNPRQKRRNSLKSILSILFYSYNFLQYLVSGLALSYWRLRQLE